MGRTLTPVFSSLAKTYAIRTSVSVGQVLEFDLGRFLGWAGNPDAVGSATLILDAPTAAGPVQAPTSVSSLTFSGNRLFFTAFDDHGFELWVTDGTKAGTRLVADLNPGVLGSYPANLVDVGGVLYFTANSGAGGTKLYRTVETVDGITATAVGDIPGFPYWFTAQPGQAELQDLTRLGPANGRPAVDTTFVLQILRQSGAVTAVPVTLTRAATEANTAVTGVGNLLDDLSAALASALTTGGLAGQVTASSDGTRFTLTAAAIPAAADIVRLTVAGGVPIGFSANQASPSSVTLLAANAGPANGQLVADLAATLDVTTVGNTVIPLAVSLAASATTGNASLADLAVNLQTVLNTALTTNGFASGAVTLTVQGSQLHLAVTDPNIAQLVVHAGTALGFSADQPSVRSVAVTGASPAPANGRLNYDLTFTVNVQATQGVQLALLISVTGAETQSNTTLAQLATQIQTKLNAALTTNGLTGNPVTVANVGGRLRFTAASPIMSLAITDATAIGITDGTRSLRVGDRLWFVTNTGTQGTELWKLESTTFTTFDVLAGSSSSNPADLVDVNGALYFTAATGASDILPGKSQWQFASGRSKWNA